MSWKVKRFNDLTVNELYAILQARVNVFVVEQNCPYHETDGKDEASIHVYAEENGRIVAYARLLPAGYSYEVPSVGRVFVEKNQRRQGTGAVLMRKALEVIEKEWAPENVMIQAQTQAKSFYEGCGFRAVSDVYYEDDIAHEDMIWKRSLQV